MLVLTRRVDERVLIGDDIVVTVVALSGTHVRLGFDAPRTVHIGRADPAQRPTPPERADGGTVEVEEMGEPPLTPPQWKALRVLAHHDGEPVVEVAGFTSAASRTVHRVSFAHLRNYALARWVNPDDPNDWRAAITEKGRERVAAERQRSR